MKVCCQPNVKDVHEKPSCQTGKAFLHSGEAMNLLCAANIQISVPIHQWYIGCSHNSG